MKKFSQTITKYQETAVSITAVLADSFGSAYFVGGFVRDMLLGNESNDIDIATSATSSEIKSILKKMKLPIVTIGEKFGTILTTVDGHMIEITTYRSETGYSDSRHPDKITFVTSAEKDAARRDFTINALYFDPESGELLDFHHGLEDIRAKKVRFIGIAKKRIKEDPLRMLRAVRFAITLGFVIEKESQKAIIDNAKLITKVSGERIRDELDKIMAHPNYHAGIALLDKLGLLEALIPELERLKTVKQSRNYHSEGNVFIHTMMVLSHAIDGWKKTKNPEIADEDEVTFRYLSLFHDLGKFGTALPTVRNGRKHMSFPHHGPAGAIIFILIARRLKFSAERTKRIEYGISHHMDLRNIHDIGPKIMAAWLQKPYVLDLIRLRYADNRGAIKTDASGKRIATDFSELERFERQFLLMHGRFSKDFISGDDVMRVCKIKTGQEVGEVLLKIRLMQASGEVKSRASALAALARMKNRKNS